MSVQRWCLKLVVGVAGGLALSSPVAAASTITVTNGADSGAGSLRAAIAAASPGDTISVPALTVRLTSGQLDQQIVPERLARRPVTTHRFLFSPLKHFSQNRQPY